MKRRRIDPDQDLDDATGAGGFSDLIKLYQLKKTSIQSMASYFTVLQQKAANIKDKCCRDEIIRSKLVQEIRDPGLLAELNVMTDPSPETVLEAHQTRKDRLLCSLILPYLRLGDINRWSKTSDRMLETIAWCLDKETQLTIDGDSLDKDTDLGLLKYAKRVTLNSVSELDVSQLIPCLFPHFHSLTMINMEIKRDLVNLPGKRLTLIRVTIDNALLNRMLKESQLEYLYLDRVKTTMLWDLDLDLQNLPHLRHLTVKGHRPRIHGDPTLFGKLMRASTTRLESIYWDLVAEDYRMPLVRTLNLKSLTLPNWTATMKFRNIRTVKHLRIIAALDPRMRKEVARLGVERVEVDYYEYASESQQNLMLKMLNSDCLLKIAEKLDTEDRLAFAHAHPDIGEVVFRHGFLRMDMPEEAEDFFEDYVDPMWEPALPFVQQLELRHEEHIFLLPLCTSIRSVIARQVMQFGQRQMDMFPTRLDELSLADIQIDTEDLYNWDVDSDCEYSDGEYDFEAEMEMSTLNRYFKKLRGVQKFNVGSQVSVPKKFYKQNKDTLTSISWCAGRDLPCALPHLTELTLESSRFTTEKELMKILRDVGSQLLRLTLVGLKVLPDNFTVTVRDLPRLEDLTFSDCQGDLLGRIGRIGTLKRVNIRNEARTMYVIEHSDHLRKVLETLPALKELYIYNFDAPLEFERQLVDYLRAEGRVLRLNGVLLNNNH